MTFPSNSGTRQDNLDVAWNTARATAGNIKTRTTALRTMLNSNTGSSAILTYATFLADARLILQKVATTPGIAAYAQQQINDGSINIAAEFTAMVSALDAVVSWIVTNFPKDGSGFLLATQFDGANNGRTTDRQFTTVQTAGLRPALDNLLATID